MISDEAKQTVVKSEKSKFLSHLIKLLILISTGNNYNENEASNVIKTDRIHAQIIVSLMA